jgi:multidrug efflux system membrane fusion protein
MNRIGRIFVSLTFGAFCFGCAGKKEQTSVLPNPEVKVSEPITKSVTAYEEFPGRTEALKTIEIRARVSGYLAKVFFADGAEVAENTPLFEIDQRPYKAALNRDEATLAQAEAHLKRVETDYKRALDLFPRGGISQADYDQAVGDHSEAVSAVGTARAVRDIAKLNFTFTTVASPVSGRLSRRMIDPGGLVTADMTPLTTIVTLDKMYAYFDVDEDTALLLKRLKRGLNSAVRLGLGDEDGFPHTGSIDFIDNQVDSTTGTLRMRGVFDNPDHVLSPGLFVRIQLPVGDLHPALLVSEKAIMRDQGQKYLFVVKTVHDDTDNDNPHDKEIVEYRSVTTGRLYDGFREVTEGLKEGEKIIVSGLQRVRADAEVITETVDMPTGKDDDTPAAPPEKSKATSKSQSSTK